MVALVSRIASFLLFGTLFVILWTLLDVYFGLGIWEGDNYNIFLAPFLMMTYLLFIFPDMRKDFFSRFVLTNEWHKVICYPILVATFCAFFINGIRFLPLLWGGEIVGVGSGQYVNDGTLSRLGELLMISILPTFSEELLVHYMPYGGLFLFLNMLLDDTVVGNRRKYRMHQRIEKFMDALFVRRDKRYLLTWLILISTGFSLMHEPTAESFPLYFIVGFIDGVFFLRYGFLAAWISHGVFNAFSGIAWEMIRVLFFK
ncbi:CPBP family glutamic-type intramembrane protease [Brevibacillus sp. AY1]|uniref:CPBP family glutamic-type intramembrane protease n=1 Tax=Brevibacillus sp. AY1 TaxID=2807621 RepID=UPI002453D86D|nr:CPBP family glutamic-type intramembrane protease [Brevibacillus sp. AY1]MDH4620192.1 CPBP family intramembrane metalloprotease [Brevibacillus sp. AY1]